MAKKKANLQDNYTQKLQRDADYFSALLSSPKCSDTFREIFATVFAEMMIGRADFSHPLLVRATFAPIVLWLDDNGYPGENEALIELLDLTDSKFNDSALHVEISQKGGAC